MDNTFHFLCKANTLFCNKEMRFYVFCDYLNFLKFVTCGLNLHTSVLVAIFPSIDKNETNWQLNIVHHHTLKQS